VAGDGAAARWRRARPAAAALRPARRAGAPRRPRAAPRAPPARAPVSRADRRCWPPLPGASPAGSPPAPPAPPRPARRRAPGAVVRSPPWWNRRRSAAPVPSPGLLRKPAVHAIHAGPEEQHQQRHPGRQSALRLRDGCADHGAECLWAHGRLPGSPGSWGAVPIPSTISTGPPFPSMIRSPRRIGTGSMTGSSFMNVPFGAAQVADTRPPLEPTVSSAWTRDTIVSEGPTGWTSHSRPRPSECGRRAPRSDGLSEPQAASRRRHALPAGCGAPEAAPRARAARHGGLEHIRSRRRRKTAGRSPRGDHVSGFEPRVTREAMSVQEGAVPAPQILELPAGRPVMQLGVQRRHDLDVRPRHDDGAIGAPAQPGDVPANLGRAAGPELDQLEVRHRAIVERRPARVNAARRAPSAQPRGLRTPAPVGEHATLSHGPAHRARRSTPAPPVGGGATLDVHPHAGPPAFRSEPAVDTGPPIVELAAVGVWCGGRGAVRSPRGGFQGRNPA